MDKARTQALFDPAFEGMTCSLDLVAALLGYRFGLIK